MSGTVITFRTATRADVPAIVALLDDDEVSRARDGLAPKDSDARRGATPPIAGVPGGGAARPDDTAGGGAADSGDAPGGVVSDVGQAPGGAASEAGHTPGGAVSEAGDAQGGVMSESGHAPGGVVSEAADARYWSAFEAIDADPRNELIVADRDGAVVGTCQLTFTPSLSRRGSERMTIEAVRVRSDVRGGGIGRAMMLWALERARERGCGLAQLTTDKRRVDAHRFYESLGFTATHEGMKLPL